MAITGHKIKHVVLRGNTLFRGSHCDKARPLEVIEQDAKQLRDDGRLYVDAQGKPAVFDNQKEAQDLIAALGWRPEVFAADQVAIQQKR